MDYTTRNVLHHKKRTTKGTQCPKIRTNKIQDRLTYCPQKHKQKYVKSLRLKLASSTPQKPKLDPPPKTSLKVGSININGLDLEATWAVEQLLDKHGFDVS